MEWTNFYQQMVERNIGIISVEEQERLRNSCIAVTGCGGMGGLSAEQLVRLGVGRVKIADFDKFEIHNLSRQHGSTSANIGERKTEVLGRYFKEINPEINLEIFNEGVKPQNVGQFLDGAEIVIDGMDYSDLENTVALYRAARQKKLCIVNPNAIGFGVSVFVFGPETVSLEEYMGFTSGKPDLKKILAYMPSYADPEIVKRAALGEINVPNIAMSQHLGTAIAVSEAVMILLGRVNAPLGPKPRIIILDLLDRKFKVTG
ncbi:MAG: ThiF family adenylyltransferase [Candidatus Omnitrophota bacterium]